MRIAAAAAQAERDRGREGEGEGGHARNVRTERTDGRRRSASSLTVMCCEYRMLDAHTGLGFITSHWLREYSIFESFEDNAARD